MKTPSFLHGASGVVIITLLIGLVFSAGCLENILILSPDPSAPAHMAENTGALSIWFLDVGQGDSSLIRFHNTTILIDAGETDMGEQVVRDLRELDVEQIDLLVATHPHSDHIGGMQAVLTAFPVGQVLDAGMPHPSPLYEKFLGTIAAKNIPCTIAQRGQTIDLDSSLRILVLSPPEKRIGDDLNTNSVVLRISYGTIDVMFTGDAGRSAESFLLTSGYPVDAEILKVGHHGSTDASSPEFIARVHPEIAVISVGNDNPYGHPHRETLDRFSAAGVTVYRTDEDGTVRVTSDGASYTVVTGNNAFSRITPLTIRPAIMIPTDTALLLPATPAIPDNQSVILPTFTVPGIPENITGTVPTLNLPQIGNTSLVKISAVQFNAPGDDRINLNGEWVQIANTGDGPVLMNGWTLTDQTASYIYIFPAYILMPATSVTVYTGSGMMNDTALFMGQTTPVWGNSGDTAVLADAQGTLIDSAS